MATVPSQPLTAQDYRELPEAAPRFQLVEGDLHLSPSPSRFHQQIVGNLFLILSKHLEDHPLGRVFLSPLDVYLDDVNVLQPDLVYVSKANEDLIEEDGIHGAPDLVIEIVSPSTAQLDKRSKRKVYARAGVKEMWLVDPALLQVHQYNLATNPDKATRIIEEDESFTSPLFPDLVIRLAEVLRR